MRELAGDRSHVVAPAQSRLGEDQGAPVTQVLDQEPARAGPPGPEGSLTEKVPVWAALPTKEVAAGVSPTDGAGDLDRVGPPDRPEIRVPPAKLGLRVGKDR